MSVEADIHQLVLGMDGISAVFVVDPLWKNVVSQLGSLLGQDGAGGQLQFVDCSTDSSGANPVMTVRLRIGADGSVPAPALARAVAAAIRTHVKAVQPDVDVVAAVEISAISV